MSKFPHSLVHQHLFIEERGLVTLRSKQSYAAPAGWAATDIPKRDWLGDAIKQREKIDGISLVPVDRVLMKSPGFIDSNTFARGYETIGDDIRASIADGSKAIILLLNSPGGGVLGSPELSAEISAASKKIPIYGFSDTLCASACYFLASGAGAGLFGTPSSQWGSIGVVVILTEFADMLSNGGVGVSVMTSSNAPRKMDGNPYEKLSTPARENIQSKLDDMAQMFLGAVTSNRPQVSEKATDGRMFLAGEAQKLGLIDGVVSDLYQLIAMVASRTGGNSTSSGASRGGVSGLKPDYAAQWRASADLQREFSDAKTYAAYEQGHAEGRVKIYQRPKQNRFSVADWKAGKLNE